MTSLLSILPMVHLIGLALGAGCANAKLTLLLRCRSDPALVPAYLAVARPITRLIILGLVLLTLSGVGWLLQGYDLTGLLKVKLALVAVMWVLGPVIDNVVEPKFRSLCPGSGQTASPAFLRIQNQYLTIEAVATGLFYVIVAIWVLG